MDVCFSFLVSEYLFFYEDKLGERLGEGSFGIVRKALHERTNKYYAIKIIDIEVKSKRKNADQEKENFEKLKGCSPYLVNLMECFDEVFYLFFCFCFKYLISQM
jgi:serine/threonine protein kinase